MCAYVSVRNLTCEVFGVVWYPNPNVCPSWALPLRVTLVLINYAYKSDSACVRIDFILVARIFRVFAPIFRVLALAHN